MKMTIFMLALCLAACGNNQQEANIGIKYEHFTNALNSKQSKFIIPDIIKSESSKVHHRLKLEYFFEPSTTLECVINQSDHLIESIKVVYKVDADQQLDQLTLAMDGPLLVSLVTQSLNQQLNPEDVEPIVLSAFTKSKQYPDVLQRETLYKASYSLKFDQADNAYIFSVNPI